MWKQDNLRVGQTYTYGWNRMGRKGQACVLEVIARKMNSVQVRFEDGHQAITSRNALKTFKPQNTTQPGLF